MTTSNNIKGLVSAFENAKEILEDAIKEMISEVFDKREMYLIPQPLWRALENIEGSPAVVWVDYRHDGENIAVWGVRCNRYSTGSRYYSVYGNECSEYCQDSVEDMTTYDIESCCDFIKWYIENDWDNKQNRLAEMLQGVESEDDAYAVIEKWREECSVCYLDTDDIDYQGLIDWAKEFTPIAE